MNLTPDERLVDALTTVIYQYPPMVREMINLSTGEEERRLRLSLFEAFSYFNEKDLTIDQITAAQLPELLALATHLNPPSFQPNNLTPGEFASQKAYSYVANYLMNRFVRSLRTVGNPPQVIEELTTDAGDVMLSQIQRLQFNYNQQFKVADYLADVKARWGLLGAMTAKQSAVLSGAEKEIVSLAGQIGQAFGTASYITHEFQQLSNDPDSFVKMITSGQYPLALLFARQQNPQWFSNFFSSDHRPSQAMFNQAYELSLKQLHEVKQLTADIFSQLILDIKVLPAGQTQDELFRLVEKLKKE
ncbi:polyprenyl synthetase family protein [Limosilactobacillus reuteri]|uniref:polyprenyl synthetase family protein n=1 Tax=Limosilactobacillus reuteri TaxID=1598 RepID=UPI001E3016DC|nr:polyprenyl synthetase family protein [Limosilactobacillus reuteri]MCC4325756.1 polyprenyl synthetase family protein [Limosilactobacillus reuteri]MCC4329669.1 polyprenyl synthetase family protein [Limosilactobacillus reuteri]MCC4352952.1 polyprenyl synthetase family protein [Limosilactobacillus reuteri]MCC4378133.1 polyprenyl synthetase family protein [Limosilactobacillus reuteri]